MSNGNVPLSDERLATMERIWAGHQTYVRELLDEVYRCRAELDEQRWYGEQLQSSIEGCSGNHVPIEAYEG